MLYISCILNSHSKYIGISASRIMGEEKKLVGLSHQLTSPIQHSFSELYSDRIFRLLWICSSNACFNITIHLVYHKLISGVNFILQKCESLIRICPIGALEKRKIKQQLFTKCATKPLRNIYLQAVTGIFEEPVES